MKIRHLLSFALIFLFFANLSIAQEPLKHTKKMYVDENGRFYANKHLPVYFFISHSASGNDKHLLKSESSPQYSNPMYFDVEGYNTLRSPSKVDTVTKKTILPKSDIRYEVYADGLAPVTYSKFIEAPRYINAKGTVFYGVGLKVELKANDRVSGVEDVYYSINGAAYQKYASPVAIASEGNYTVKYYSVDNVGNAEEPKSKTFVVDMTTPITTYKVNGEITNDIISPKASIILSVTDNLSGVKRTYYSFDKGRPILYTRPVTLSHLKDGQHKMTFYSVDNVKNNEKDDGARTVEYDFYLDRSVPFAAAEVVGDQYAGKRLYISERSKIKLTSTDNKGGVNVINYGVNKSARSDVYNEPFAMPTRKGVHTVNYIATDNVKNVTPNHRFSIYMDNVAPKSTIYIGTPKFTDRDTLFVTKDSDVKLVVSDYESGVQKVEYAIDGDTYLEYKQFNVPQDGFHVIKYKSTDRVNNVETVKTQEILVDNTSPKIHAFFSVNPIGSETVDGKTYNVYPTYTRVFLAATDRYSGTQSIMYSINGGYMKSYLGAQNISETNMLSKEGVYVVKIVAKDKLGNASEHTLEFVTRKTMKAKDTE